MKYLAQTVELNDHWAGMRPRQSIGTIIVEVMATSADCEHIKQRTKRYPCPNFIVLMSFVPIAGKPINFNIKTFAIFHYSI